MSREADLDRARQYYELLYSNPDVSTKFPSVSAGSVSQSHKPKTTRKAESRVYKRWHLDYFWTFTEKKEFRDQESS